ASRDKRCAIVPAAHHRQLKERGDVGESGDRNAQGKGSWLRRRGADRGSQSGERETSTAAVPAKTAKSPAGAPVGSSLPAAIWTDSHCHLQDDPDPAETVALARKERVGRMVCVGTDEASSRRGRGV